MHSTLLVLAGILATTVLAVPNNNKPSCKPFTDNFDNITANPLRATTPVGTNNGITYQGFGVAVKSPATGSTAAIIPHSGSQDALASLSNDVLMLGSVTLNPFGNIVSSPSKAFDLYSFWFGCAVATQNSAVAAAQACVLSVIGFNIAGQQLPVATFSYSPKNPTIAPMVLAVLPANYRGLKNVTIGLASANVTPAGTALLVDDVTHCNYK